MKSHVAKSGVFVLSLAVAVAFASSPALPQTDPFMSQGRSSVEGGIQNPVGSGFAPNPRGDMYTVQPDRNMLPGVGLSPLLDASMVEALQRQKATQERTIQERALQQDAVRLEEQQRQGPPRRRGFFSDSQ